MRKKPISATSEVNLGTLEDIGILPGDYVHNCDEIVNNNSSDDNIIELLREPVWRDGNCFFALNLIHHNNMESNILGFTIDQPISLLVQKLREVLVAEWLS